MIVVKSLLLLYYRSSWGDFLCTPDAGYRPHPSRSCSPPWAASCPHRAALLGSCLPTGMLHCSSPLPTREAREECFFLQSPACAIPWCLPAGGGLGTGEGQQCCRRQLAPGPGGGTSFGLAPGKLSSAALVPALCSPLPRTCRAELLAEVCSSDHLLVFSVQRAPCLEDTSGRQRNGVKGEILQKRQDPPSGIQPPTTPGSQATSPLHSLMARVFFKTATLVVSPFCNAAFGLSIPSSLKLADQE